MQAPPASVSDAFLADHEMLNALLGKLLAALEADDHEAAARMWTECESALSAHLQVEETYLIPALARVCTRDARVLVQEHRHIRTRLAELGNGIDRHVARSDTVRDFIDELRAHAQSEDRLLYKWADDWLEESQRVLALGAVSESAALKNKPIR
jgi:hemerythrin-like domain-containing protein